MGWSYKETYVSPHHLEWENEGIVNHPSIYKPNKIKLLKLG